MILEQNDMRFRDNLLIYHILAQLSISMKL